MTQKKPRLPTCHLCGKAIGEGLKLKKTGTVPSKTLYLCLDCDALIHAIAHDAVASIIEDLSNVVCRKGESWKEELSPYSYEEKAERR